MKKRFLIPFLFAFFSGAALAQQAQSFDELDANADGSLSEDEVSAVVGLDFASADMDGDGSLSRDEYDSATGGASTEGDAGIEGGEGGASTDFGTESP